MTESEEQADPRDAIGKIVKILEPLKDAERLRVLAAVQAFLGPTLAPPPPNMQKDTQRHAVTRPMDIRADIRALKEEKQPRTDIEMAAVMAYYLKEQAPTEETKDSVSADDVEKYFKQAGAKLPKHSRQTLQNAKNAGYFESSGAGLFKLNPVGYNLVAHSLPRPDSGGTTKHKPGKKKAQPRKKTGKAAKK